MTSKMKDDISKIFLLAGVINRYFSLGKGSEAPKPWEYYPDLFADEAIKYEEARSEEELELAKQRRKEFAKIHNERRKS